MEQVKDFYFSEDGDSNGKMPSIEDIVQALGIAEYMDTQKFEDRVRNEANPFFYRMWGLSVLEKPDADALTRMKEWKDELTRNAENEWGRTKGELLNSFNIALNVLYQCLATSKYEYEFEPNFRQSLWRDFTVEIKAKCADGVVDVFEMHELINEARRRHLWLDDAGKQEIIERIKAEVKQSGAQLETWQDTFVRNVSRKDASARVDTTDNRAKLLAEYKKCLSASDLKQTMENDESRLMSEMDALLGKFNLSLAAGTEIYKKEYFYKTVVEKHLDLKKPLSAQEYYELKLAAINQYNMSEAEWEKFAAENGVAMSADSQPAPAAKLTQTTEHSAAVQAEETETCASCGAVLPKGSLFCNKCGTKIEPPITNCPRCGAELPKGAKFCNECGAKIKTEAQYMLEAGFKKNMILAYVFNRLKVDGRNIRFITSEDIMFDKADNPSMMFGKNMEEAMNIFNNTYSEYCVEQIKIFNDDMAHMLEAIKDNVAENAGAKDRYANRFKEVFALISQDKVPCFKFSKIKNISADGIDRSDVGLLKQLAKEICGIELRSSVPNDDMVLIQGGTFKMGSKVYGDEKPVHDVTLSSYYISKYQVTQNDWEKVMGYNSSEFEDNPANGEKQGLRPVENVSWYDVIKYCNKRSVAEGLTPCYAIDRSTDKVTNGKVPYDSNNGGVWDRVTCDWNADGYRLPTEAEWEYAARGGGKASVQTEYSGSDNIDEVAWYAGNSQDKTHQVGLKKPNAAGVYDMSGNVWEWCWDWYGHYTSEAESDPRGASSGDLRFLRGVSRGGSWDSSADYCRVSYRDYYLPHCRLSYLGLRVCCRA